MRSQSEMWQNLQTRRRTFLHEWMNAEWVGIYSFKVERCRLLKLEWRWSAVKWTKPKRDSSVKKNFEEVCWCPSPLFRVKSVSVMPMIPMHRVAQRWRRRERLTVFLSFFATEVTDSYLLPLVLPCLTIIPQCMFSLEKEWNTFSG
jgi:hypothetical protein